MPRKTEPLIHVGVSWLRQQCAQTLKSLPSEPIVIHHHSEPLACGLFVKEGE